MEISQKLKSSFPILYQLYSYAKDYKQLRINRKIAKQIHRMSSEALMDYDAELYFRRIGHKLDWNNLQTWTEKMQWEKIFDNNPEKIICADKYEVRKWVAERIGDKYLIPLIGVWDRYNDVSFADLPQKFVMKTNHGSGDIVIVPAKDKMTLADRLAMRRVISIAERMDYGAEFCELHYSKMKSKVIAEELIGEEGADLQDYKFFCFGGIPYYCMVYTSRREGLKQYVYDMDWKLQNWGTADYVQKKDDVPKPEHFDEMLGVVKALSKGFSHVRVDLYNVRGKIYFGEMTFTGASGFHRFSSEEADYHLGQLWDVDCKMEMRNE